MGTTGTFSKVLIIGASGGIGTAVVKELPQHSADVEIVCLSRSLNGFDITDEMSVADWANRLSGPFDLIFVCTGILGTDHFSPEKSLADVTSDKLAHQFRTNTIGPALCLKHFYRHLPTDRASVFAILSARVGSIEDNKLGGWVSYRTSKAALNQVVRTAAVEISRRRPKAACISLHPGTVETELSRPFVGRHPSVTPGVSARHLLNVLTNIRPGDTGRFLDWQGKNIPF